MPKIDPKTTKSITTFLANNWWKVVIILLAAGISASGLTCPTPWGVMEKTKVYDKAPGGAE